MKSWDSPGKFYLSKHKATVALEGLTFPLNSVIIIIWVKSYARFSHYYELGGDCFYLWYSKSKQIYESKKYVRLVHQNNGHIVNPQETFEERKKSRSLYWLGPKIRVKPELWVIAFSAWALSWFLGCRLVILFWAWTIKHQEESTFKMLYWLSKKQHVSPAYPIKGPNESILNSSECPVVVSAAAAEC
jgi:hypothetical protein